MIARLIVLSICGNPFLVFALTSIALQVCVIKVVIFDSRCTLSQMSGLMWFATKLLLRWPLLLLF